MENLLNFMKKDISTVVEITDTHIKFLQAKMGRGPLVITCAIRSLNNYTNEEIINNLIEMGRLAAIHPEQFIAIVPRRLIILKQLRLPSLEETEIKKMVGLQLVNQIPYPLEDVIYEYFILEKESSGYTQLLVIIVHKEVSERYLKIFEKVGIHPGKLTLSSLGILGWWNYQALKAKSDLTQVVSLIHIDHAHTEICFCRGGNLLFSRSINYGTKDLKGDNFIGLLTQIELSLQAYEKENMGPAMKKMIIISALHQTHALKEKLETQFKIPVEEPSPLDNITSSKNINLAQPEEQGVSLAIDIGVLLLDPKKLINLLPVGVHDTKKTQYKRRQWIKFISLFLLTAVLALSIAGIEYYQKLREWQVLQERTETQRPQLAQAKKTIEVVNLFEEKLKERIFIADLMDELYTLIPSDIAFRSLQMDERGLFTIQGYAETAGSVNSFQANLLKSPTFKEVNLQFATKRKIFNMEVTDFKMTAQLNLKNVEEKND